MQQVRAKKNLGQHFLNDPQIARQIVDAISCPNGCRNVLEVGPGMGILTDFLLAREDLSVKMIDIDSESVSYLQQKFPLQSDKIIEGDFLRLDLSRLFNGEFIIIGNFPYNISSQILFRILDERSRVPEVVGMFQKEVAERIAGSPGSREYGILSVFMQAWYNVDLIMQLDEKDFSPPPKVKSAVLHFLRKENFELGADEKLFRKVVKAAFNQKRKTLRNALSVLVSKEHASELPFAGLRAETLSWQKFVELTNAVSKLIAAQ